ncbi:MAG: LysR family transcriptional regulator [Eubacteriales bacterium]|nr:LysR family transcriptional regulator [Eubacteriales bacterium]MDD4390419.1 LysR family transcriptional regulator [Eubacteriales bacterium]
MSLNAYRIFCTVAVEKSFFRAAEMLYLTPSAVSHSISTLEDKFGFSLFFRNRTGARLTSDGERLLPFIRNVLESDERLIQESDRVQGFMSGTVHLGAISSVCNNWIVDILGSFHNKFPQIEVHLTQSGYDNILLEAKAGSIDLSFTSTYTNESLMTIPLSQDPLICVTPVDYEPLNGEFITRGDIMRNNLILQRESSDYDTIALLRQKNIPLQSKHRIEEDSTILHMVSSGYGIAIVPSLVYKGIPCNVNAYPIEGDPYRTLGLVFQEKKLLTPAISQMYEHIISFVKDNNIYNINEEDNERTGEK